MNKRAAWLCLAGSRLHNPDQTKKPPVWVGTQHGGDDQGLRKAQSSASTNSRGYASPIRIFTTPTKQKNHPFGVGTLHGGDDQGLRKAQSSASTNSRGYASPVRVFTTPTKQKTTRLGGFLFGGDDQTRTDYLYVANVSLYRVSYIPAPESFFIIPHSRKFFNRFLCSFEKNFFDLFTFFLSSCERACPA